MSIRNIVFDFGGVLVDWNPRHLYRKIFHGDEASVEAFLKEVEFSSWNLRADRGEKFADLFREVELKTPKLLPYAQLFKERFIESIGGPIEGSVQILKRLQDNPSYDLFGLTNWSAETFPLAYEKFSFFKIFKDILVSGEHHLLKPQPEIYALALKRFQIRPEDSVFIDDKKENVIAAENCGWKGIEFRDPQSLIQALQKLGIQMD